MKILDFIDTLEEELINYEKETFMAFRFVAENILKKNEDLLVIYRKEFEDLLKDEDFRDNWGTPTKENPHAYQERDFECWLKDCLENQTLKEILESVLK